ncbi:MAG: hypothetical protein V7L25_31555 [Nostoc sp.]
MQNPLTAFDLKIINRAKILTTFKEKFLHRETRMHETFRFLASSQSRKSWIELTGQNGSSQLHKFL